MTKHYPETNATAHFPKIEEEILKFWEENKIFEKSIENRSKAEEFVFYDGPPFANGLPHYGHLMISLTKDLVARFQTMDGKKVERRLGWDCHGLPAEMGAEKALNIFGKKAIEEYGIEKFNEYCRSDVMKYSTEWIETLKRLGRWVDYKNDYKTMDLPYMESVINNFKKLYDKGLIFEDYRISPYSWKAESTVSNFEVNQAYADRTDSAITVSFELENGMYALVWTTTPWTLPSNLMLAVNESITYSIMENPADKKQYIIASKLQAKYKKQLEGFKEVKQISGKDLVGLSYKPIFTYLSENTKYAEEIKQAKAFHILSGDFVSEEDGTGIVHMAPAFGEDDFNACRKYGENIGVKFPIICPIDEKGNFTEDIKDYEGENVFEANDKIIDKLKLTGQLFKKESYTHSYPHCWRTDTPLIYKAMKSWYVRMSDFQEKMVEINNQINWIPSHLKEGRMGKWLAGAKDWSISRNRFWGAPIPVWKSDDDNYPNIEVLGSIEEIEKKCGKKIKDLHRPYIDEVVYPNEKDPTGKSMMRRVEDVFDCWFESGSMPYAQIHYPFENKEWFEQHFPADFIIEAIDQTRGWFYTLIALSTTLHNKPSFKTCMCAGHVMGANNQKLSKRLKNYPDPKVMFDSVGSDALRWFFMSSPILKGEGAEIDKEGTVVSKVSRLAQIPLYNSYHFFTLYANADNIKAEEITKDNISKFEQNFDELDKYILAKLDTLSEKVYGYLKSYEIAYACKEIEKFLDILNNWYIRLNRRRFWGTGINQNDQQIAFNVLYTVIINICKISAPILPFTTEYIYKNLTGDLSVHLCDYPKSLNFANNEYATILMNSMDKVSNICKIVKNLREQFNLRNRLPISDIKVVGLSLENLSQFTDIIKSESNSKEVIYEDKIENYAEKFLYIYTPIIGKRLGAKLANIIKASKAGEYKITKNDNNETICEIAGEVLFANEFEERLNIKDKITGKALEDNSAIVIINTEITDDLRIEGVARDFIRQIQEERKNQNLNVSDRIKIYYNEDDTDISKAIEKFAEYIKDETLSTEIIPSKEFKIALI